MTSPDMARMSRLSNRWRQRIFTAAPYGVLAVLWLLFFWRFLTPQPADRLTYPPGDFSETFGVFRNLAYRSLLDGRLPLWTDCLYSGYPLHADPQAQVFYPPAWAGYGLLALQGWGHFPLDALVAEILAHYLLISITTFLFLRSLSLRPAAALLGATVFTYGGYLTGYPPLQYGILAVAAWLPLALLCAGRLAQTRRPRHAVWLALTMAMAYLAGHPATFLYLLLLVLAYLAFRAVAAGWQLTSLARAGALISALLVLVTAVQLLPTLQFVANSTRAAIPFALASGGFPFADLVQFFLTGFVSYWHPLYVGLLPLALVFAAFGLRRREVLFWAGAGLVGLLLSFGTRAVVFDVAYWSIPGVGLFRGQERWALWVSFSLAVLAAHGAQSLWAPLGRSARTKVWRGAQWLAIAAIAAIVLLVPVTYLARLGYDPSDWGQLPDRLGLMAAALGMASLALVLRAGAARQRKLIPALWLGIIVIDLFAANRPLNVVPVYEAYPHNPLLEAVLHEPGFFRVQDDFQLAGHSGCAYGYAAIEGVTPYRMAAYQRFLEQAPERLRWELLGVKYVVTWRAQLRDDAGQPVDSEVVAAGNVPDARGNVTSVHRLPVTPRRAVLVYATVVDTAEAALAHLAASEASAWQSVVVPRPAAAAPGEGQVTVARDTPGWIELTTTSSAPAVLVVSQAHALGWRAHIDGRPAPLLQAYGALLGIEIPAGQHEVVLYYRPASLIVGSLLTMLGLFGMLVLATWGDRHWLL
jgi:hypothetical protein